MQQFISACEIIGGYADFAASRGVSGFVSVEHRFNRLDVMMIEDAADVTISHLTDTLTAGKKYIR